MMTDLERMLTLIRHRLEHAPITEKSSKEITALYKAIAVIRAADELAESIIGTEVEFGVIIAFENYRKTRETKIP